MRILWLKTELLHPIDKGGKIRTYNMLKELKRQHHITYLTLDDGMAGEDARERASEYCHELLCIPHRTRTKFSAGFYVDLAINLVSPLPYFMTKYRSLRMRQEIAQRTQQDRFDLLVCDFLMPSINVPADVRCATLLFQHNVEAMIWKRHYEVQSNPVIKAYFYNQWNKTRSFERKACRRFDQVVTVSANDRDTIQCEYQLQGVFDVPTGVDTEYFRPKGGEQREPHNLVFTGSMDWLPNQDAIHYFTEQILPRIKEKVPDATLTVVGRNPHPALLELSKRDPSIIITGGVDDVRPYMERAAAYVVPLRIGGGTRLKIFEAMAMEKAIVSSTIGAEGLPLHEGLELLLADTPAAFADAVLRVITNGAFARALGTRAARTARTHFGWDRVATSFAASCESACRLRGQRTTGAGP